MSGGILRLRKSCGPDRLEAACGRAFEINGLSCSSVASILKNNIDRRPPDPDAADRPTIHHQHRRASTLVTSQIPIERWQDIVAEPTMADAILDRLVHNARKITSKGEPMRKRDAKRLDDRPAA